MSLLSHLQNLLPQRSTPLLPEVTAEQIAKILHTTPHALEQFQKAYSLVETPNPKDAASKATPSVVTYRQDVREQAQSLYDQIVDDLVAQTRTYSYAPTTPSTQLALPYHPTALVPLTSHVEVSDVRRLPQDLRPQLTGDAVARDMPPTFDDRHPWSYLYYEQMFRAQRDEIKARWAHHQFHIGLEVLDMTPLIYSALSSNIESMGYWFPRLVDAVHAAPTSLFALPATTIARVPMALLQMSRLTYDELQPSTLSIANAWAQRVFTPAPHQSVFIRHGVSSNKFDARNTIITPDQTHELGEFFLYNHYRDALMPLTHSIYGKASSVEWVMRELIPDTEQHPTIYHGLPLRTEFRVFVDCETDTVLGCSPYWEEKKMCQHFEERIRDPHPDPEALHDKTTFLLAKDRLAQEYDRYHSTVVEHMQRLVPHLDLPGQWSVDVMLADGQFYIIDMALAQSSAFYEVVPPHERRPLSVQFRPTLDAPSDSAS